MKRTFLLAGVAAVLCTGNAHAYDLNLNLTPYLAAKATYGWLQSNSNVGSSFYLHKGTPVNGDGTYKDNQISDKTLKDNVWGTRLAYGLQAPLQKGQLRAEIELGWNNKSGDDNLYNIVIKAQNNGKYNGEHFQLNTAVYSGMFNMYYDFATDTKFTPYIGAGLGYARVKTKAHTWGHCGTPANTYDLSFNKSANNFAFHIDLGGSYALTDQISLDLGYRYTNFGRIKTDPTIRDSMGKMMGVDGPFMIDGDIKVTMHEINLGLRYAF